MTMTLWIIIALGITITLPKHFSDQAAVMGAVGVRGAGCWKSYFYSDKYLLLRSSFINGDVPDKHAWQFPSAHRERQTVIQHVQMQSHIAWNQWSGKTLCI